MAVPRSRLQDLIKLQCRIYQQSYNPSNIRTGAKILRERLRGPALASWYPKRVLNTKEIEYFYMPDHEVEVLDEDESDRWDSLALRKARGKGNPPKKKEATDKRARKK